MDRLVAEAEGEPMEEAEEGAEDRNPMVVVVATAVGVISK